MIDIPKGVVVRPLLVKTRSVLAYCCLIDESGFDDGLPWYHDIYQFLRYGVTPPTRHRVSSEGSFFFSTYKL